MVSSASLTNYETKVQTASYQNNNGSINTRVTSNSNNQQASIKRNNLNINSSKMNVKPIQANSNQFSINLSTNGGDFYFRTLLRFVRSGNNDNYAEKLEFLLKQCPTLSSTKSSASSTLPPSSSLSISNHHQHHHHHHHHHSSSCTIKLTERSRSALIALLILIVENYHSINKTEDITSSTETNTNESKNSQQNNLNPELVGYLLALLENLPNLKWVEDPLTTNSYSGSSKQNSILFFFIPIAEN